MICRKLYAHKGSILLNSGSDHGKPRRFFLLRVFSGEDLVCYSCAARCCIGQEPDGTETPYKKRRFAARAQTLNAHCFVRFASFAAFKKNVAVHRAADQQPQYQAERARCAGYGLVTKFSSKITNSSESKRKRKRKLMRSGGISDEDVLNRPFPFVLVVNNPNESNS